MTHRERELVDRQEAIAQRMVELVRIQAGLMQQARREIAALGHNWGTCPCLICTEYRKAEMRSAAGREERKAARSSLRDPLTIAEHDALMARLDAAEREFAD